jgi:cytokinesis protein
MGGPPPPPPPPGGLPRFMPAAPGFATTTNSIGLPVVRPKKKLKAFHWDKVDSPMTTHWAAHTPTAEEREEKYLELRKKGILDEVEKMFMAKEVRALGGGGAGAKKDDKKQLISSELHKAFREFIEKGVVGLCVY